MSGRQRLPGGEPRKASQRNTRRAVPIVIRLGPTWRAGDRVRWLGLAGVFRRDLDDRACGDCDRRAGLPGAGQGACVRTATLGLHTKP